VWCADDGEGFILAFEELGSAHIDEFHVPLVVDHDIFRLDVSVDDGELVQVLDADDQRPNVELRIVSVEQPDIADDIKQLHAFDVLHQEKDVVVVLHRLDELHDERELHRL
jgi:hypothetical protein